MCLPPQVVRLTEVVTTCFPPPHAFKCILYFWDSEAARRKAAESIRSRHSRAHKLAFPFSISLHVSLPVGEVETLLPELLTQRPSQPLAPALSFNT